MSEELEQFLDENEEPSEIDHDEAEEVEQASPPGFKTHEEWMAEGKDPEKYKGRKAYEAEYARIQEVKELKNSVKSISETLRSTVEAIAERESKAEARHRRELEAALAKAKEDGDTDAALDASEQLHELRARPPVQHGLGVHPALVKFLDDNPILEDPGIRKSFARIYDTGLANDGVKDGVHALTEEDINAYTSAAMRRIKELYPERFASTKNSRTVAPIKSKPASAPADPAARLTGEAAEIYNMLKAKDPATAADFAKRMASN